MAKKPLEEVLKRAKERADKEDRRMSVWHREHDGAYLVAPEYITGVARSRRIATVDSEDTLWQSS